MTTAIIDTSVIAAGRLRSLRRQPTYLIMTLSTPLVWLILFGQLFSRMADLPGFETGNYISYLTPGVVVMTAVMTAGWAGTDLIEDMERGVMNRYLTSSMTQSALVTGTVIYNAAITVIQTAIVLVIGWLLGAQYAGGAAGILAVILIAILVTGLSSALSCAMALSLRSQGALIGMSQMLILPLIFLSSMLIAPELLPEWIRAVATVNPIDWAAQASREALGATADWLHIGIRVALLVMVWIGASGLASLALRSYRRNS